MQIQDSWGSFFPSWIAAQMSRPTEGVRTEMSSMTTRAISPEDMLRSLAA
jgi:hypothetical protein